MAYIVPQEKKTILAAIISIPLHTPYVCHNINYFQRKKNITHTCMHFIDGTTHHEGNKRT